jgi:hypothetical protein
MWHESRIYDWSDWIDRGVKAGWNIDNEGNFVFERADDALRFKRGTASLDLSMIAGGVMGRRKYSST